MTSNPKTEELLPPAAADRSSGVRLTQTDEISIINRRGRSTHPQEKSVRRSGATPFNTRENGVRRLAPEFSQAEIETKKNHVLYQTAQGLTRQPPLNVRTLLNLYSDVAGLAVLGCRHGSFFAHGDRLVCGTDDPPRTRAGCGADSHSPATATRHHHPLRPGHAVRKRCLAASLPRQSP